MPPPGAAVTAAALSPKRWIEHRVIPGERLKEIAQLYGVSPEKLVEWNELGEHPMIRIGQKLRVHTRAEPVLRKRKVYRVKRGDSWSRIARAHGVDQSQLRKRWNSKHEGELMRGDKVIVWVEVEPEVEPEREPDMVIRPEEAGEIAVNEKPDERPVTQPQPARTLDSGLGVVDVRADGQSVGRPGRGRLRKGVALPANPALYTIRNPAHSYGSSHTIKHLQDAILQFRKQSGFERELLIKDISTRRGGRLRPHNSHRSGRDVDIRLPARAGVPEGTSPEREAQVDWDAAWVLIKAMIDTGEVQYIFLSRPRQRALYKAALQAGMTEEQLVPLIQYPERTRTTVVRHSRGHTSHIHVRFKCGAEEPNCHD